MSAEPFDLVRVGLWLVAGLIALSFSVGNARIWTSISTGFFLVFVSEAYLVAPSQSGLVTAMHSVVGTIAAMVITYGFMEYYVFSRTLEAGGQKWVVYATTAAVLLGSVAFLLVNVTPGPQTIRHMRLVENTSWTLLSLINLDLLRKIYAQVRDSPIARGFLGFIVVFFFVFLWRGSMLYLEVWGFDADASALRPGAGALDPADYPFRVALSTAVNRLGSVGASLSVGAVFAYLFRALR